MSRMIVLAAVGLSCLLLVVGCKHLAETKTIAEFTRSLQEEDLDGLRSISSERFNEHALRATEALDDLEILRLPEDKPTVVNVEEIDRDTKRVTVKVGDSEREVFYELVREMYDGPWRVNEVYLQQKRKGVVAYKSVSEQMNLLLSVREFYQAWSSGDRTEVLQSCEPELREQLAMLPPAYLARLTAQVAEKRRAGSPIRPTAQMDDDIAVVRIPRKSGAMVVTFAAEGEQWFAVDIAVDSKDENEKIVSLLKLTRAASVGMAFLNAYEAEDKSELQSLSTRNFFDGSLAIGDLREVPLPNGSGLGYEFEVQVLRDSADLILTTPDELVRLSLSAPADEQTSDTADYRVADVTVYDLADKQQKRLSAIFTAQAMMQLFADALNHRDLDMLRHSSTPDFNNRIWDRFDQQSLSAFPVDIVAAEPPHIVSTEFQGSLTEVTATQGEQAVTYVLREHLGRFFVDDVIVPLEHRPTSLKSNLEVMMPVVAFHKAFQTGRVAELQPISSRDFNTIIWSQFEVVPDSGMQVVSNLRRPISAIETGESSAVVTLGDDHDGARLLLVREANRWVVDELLLIDGVEPEQRHRYKHSIRVQLAEGKYRRNPGDQKIQQVSMKTADGIDNERRPPRRLTDPQQEARPLPDAGRNSPGPASKVLTPPSERPSPSSQRMPPQADSSAAASNSDDDPLDRESELLDRLDLPQQSEPGASE